VVLRRIFALAFKELLAIMRDRKSRIIVLLPPLVQLVVFSYAATFDLSHLNLAVYNQDTGPAARELVAAFSGSNVFHVAARLNREAQIAPAIDSRRALMVLHIGPRFSADLASHRSAPVQIIVDGRDSNTALIAYGYASHIVQQFNERWERAHGAAAAPATLVQRAWFNTNLESRWFIVPGLVAVITMVVVTMIASLSVAREREQGTFDQLLVTPLRPMQILAGKALPAFLIGFVEANLIILVAIFWFQVPMRGSLGALYLGLALFLLAIVGVGLMLSSVAATMQQGLMGGFLFLVPAVILSGFATPIANMPAAVQYVTYLDPLRYFLIIVRRIFLEATPTRLLVLQYAPLIAIAAVTLTAAAALFRRRLY